MSQSKQKLLLKANSIKCEKALLPDISSSTKNAQHYNSYDSQNNAMIAKLMPEPLAIFKDEKPKDSLIADSIVEVK